MMPGAATTTSRAHRLVLVALLAVLASACGEGDTTAGDPLDGSRWEMTRVWNGTALVAANPTTIATLVFAGGTAGGSTGCNFFQAAYTQEGDSLSFGDISLTGSACKSGYVAQGDDFVHALRASDRFTISEDTLDLTDAGGTVQLQFRAAIELPLVGITWQLAWYGGGTAPVDDTQISLVFRPDGTLAGIAGCNDYFADYQVDGKQLTIEAIAHTERACLEPDGVMSQETAYVAVLQQAQAFATSLTGLELLDTGGTPVAEYRFGGRVRDTASN